MQTTTAPAQAPLPAAAANPAGLHDPGVKPPKLISAIDAEFSEEARRDKVSAISVQSVIVGTDGMPYGIRSKKPAGHGLDEQAAKALSQYKFSPATRNGVPVAMEIAVEVHFNYSDKSLDMTQRPSPLLAAAKPAIPIKRWVPSSEIGNDPYKEGVCIERSAAQFNHDKPVPFLIDESYLKRSREMTPDSTFIAIDGTLIECELRSGTGRFEPASFSPEQWFWQIPRPGFNPGLNSAEGPDIAARVCMTEAPKKISAPDFVRSNYEQVVEVQPGRPIFQPGARVAGAMAERYDIVVKGDSYYKSTGIDLTDYRFTCLLSPTLEIKSIAVARVN